MAYALGSKTFEWKEKFTLESGAQKLTENGAIAISTLLLPYFESSDYDSCWCSAHIADRWAEIGGDGWIGVGNKVYQGTLAKRIAKKFKRDYDVKLPSSVVEQIGTVARANMTEVGSQTCDITNRIDWRAGKFGDEGSCWWGGNSDARNVFMRHGGLALRFYDENGEGIGRCWLVPDAPQQGMALIFNSYWGEGTRSSYMDRKDSQLINMAISLASHTGLSYRKINDLRNCGAADELVWINNHSGYVIGEREAIAALPDQYDLRMATDRHTHRCHHCQMPIMETSRVRLRGDDVMTRYVCRPCRNARYEGCGHCGMDMERGAGTMVSGETWCAHCYERDTVVCTGCNERHARTRLFNVYQQDTRLCASCCSRRYQCPECGIFHAEHNGDMVTRQPCPRCEAAVRERTRVQRMRARLCRIMTLPSDIRTEAGLISAASFKLRLIIERGIWNETLQAHVESVFERPFAEVFPSLVQWIEARNNPQATQPMLPDMNLPEVVSAFRRLTPEERAVVEQRERVETAAVRMHRERMRERLRQERITAASIAIDDEEVPF